MSRSSHSQTQVHSTNLDYTLRELSRNVQEYEKELEKLRADQRDEPISPASQAEIIAAALEDVTNSRPFLPFAGSILPALLALRKTHQTIQESRTYLSLQSTELDNEKRDLDHDQAGLKDQHLLTDALTARIESLREELDSSRGQEPEDSAKERLDELRKRKKSYDRETTKLMRSLNTFMDEQLAPMLAAEELGGPVVGDMMDIDTEDLSAGFSSQGKLKRAKEGGSGGDDKRQRRIDEIWGQRVDGLPEAASRGDHQENEADAAGADMRELTEELLNRTMEARGDSSEAYSQLPRESAAARFLVRSKVAQFHPKDATRIKLLDFGRELEE